MGFSDSLKGFVNDFINPVSAIGNFASTAFSAFSSKKGEERANEQNIEQAQENRAWQERMSSTAHQREVEDLRKAGLNPLLSAHGGASTPSGSMATSENVYKDLPSNLVNSARVALETKLNQANLQKIQSETAYNSAAKAKVEAETTKTVAETPRYDALGKLGNFVTRGLDALDNTVAWTGRKLGEKTANINIPKLRKN